MNRGRRHHVSLTSTGQVLVPKKKRPDSSMDSSVRRIHLAQWTSISFSFVQKIMAEIISNICLLSVRLLCRVVLTGSAAGFHVNFALISFFFCRILTIKR
jgi:hypothetical protein